MKLFLVHCGYYDMDVGDGIYESHTNFFIAAESFENARVAIKSKEVFNTKKMHVDGLIEIQAVDGFQVSLSPETTLKGKTILNSHRHRDLAPKLTN